MAALDDSQHPIAVSRRCVDVLELLSVAAAGHGRAALVAADLRHFDADAVDRLAAAEVVPVAVVERGNSVAVERMRSQGVQFTVPSDADPGVIASVVAAALADDRFATDALPADPAARPTVPERRGSATARRGRVVAVWGPTGAPGRTTVATGLADEIARLGRSTVLIDADVYGGVVAAVLGLLDESPGLAAACRSAAARRLDAATLATLCWQLRPSFRVLTGLPLAQRWPEVRASAIAPVLEAARALADWTVVDCGFALEADDEFSADSLTPRRNGATLAVLAEADLVVVVGAADPIGIQRLIRALGELRDVRPGGRIHLVVNRCRPGIRADDPASEVSAALTRLAGHAPDSLLPYDRPALDAALSSGRLLAEIRPSSPVRRALVALAAAVLDVPVPAARHRRGA